MSIRTQAFGPYIQRGDTEEKFYRAQRVATIGSVLWTASSDDLVDVPAAKDIIPEAHPQAKPGYDYPLSAFRMTGGRMLVQGWLHRVSVTFPDTIAWAPIIKFPIPFQCSGVSASGGVDKDNIAVAIPQTGELGANEYTPYEPDYPYTLMLGEKVLKQPTGTIEEAYYWFESLILHVAPR